MEIGATGSSTLELTVHVRAHPAPDWLACRARTRYLTGGYHEEDFESGIQPACWSPSRASSPYSSSPGDLMRPLRAPGAIG
jgi:hypothetical protein